MGAQKRKERKEGRKTKKSQDFRFKIDLIYLMLVSVSCNRRKQLISKRKIKKNVSKTWVYVSSWNQEQNKTRERRDIVGERKDEREERDEI